MRTNLPITQKEVQVPENSYLVSKTDRNSVITEVNELFVEISGFNREELIGQTHNLVRHPDMPAVVFADMWASLKAGMPWRGIVKNRRKDGDHYWVSAQVVPIMKGGQVTGYMSVRTAATREQISAAETLYRQIRDAGKFTTPPTRVRSVKKTFTTILAASGLALLAVVILAFTLLSHAGNSPEEVRASLVQAQTILVVQAVLMMIILGSIAWLVYGRLINPINRVRDNILQLAEGDLSQRYAIHRPDEIGQVGNALITMQTQWMVSLDHIVRSVEQTRSSMTAVNSESRGIHSHLQHQYERIAATAATTEEFYQSVAEVASSAADTSQAASESGTLLEHNRHALGDGMRAADLVAASVIESNETIQALDNAVGRIGEITQVIKDIADQTNLLALNAAIEAARAGEQGRGFAVVADEVRKLAERTAGSTREISSMIGNIQSLAKDVVGSMGEADSAVQNSTEKMRESAVLLDNVAKASSRTVGLAQHIADASDQQKTAGEDIARNMEVVSRLAEENQDKLQGLWENMNRLENATHRISEAVGIFRVFAQPTR